MHALYIYIYIAVVIGRRQCFRPQQHWIVKKSSLVYMVTRTVQLQKGDQQSAELRMKDGEKQQGTFRAYYQHCAYFFRWLCLMHCCWKSTKFCNLKMEISCTLLFHGSRQIRSFFLQNVKQIRSFFVQNVVILAMAIPTVVTLCNLPEQTSTWISSKIGRTSLV